MKKIWSYIEPALWLLGVFGFVILLIIFYGNRERMYKPKKIFHKQKFIPIDIKITKVKEVSYISWGGTCSGGGDSISIRLFSSDVSTNSELKNIILKKLIKKREWYNKIILKKNNFSACATAFGIYCPYGAKSAYEKGTVQNLIEVKARKKNTEFFETVYVSKDDNSLKPIDLSQALEISFPMLINREGDYIHKDGKAHFNFTTTNIDWEAIKKDIYIKNNLHVNA